MDDHRAKLWLSIVFWLSLGAALAIFFAGLLSSWVRLGY